MQRDILDTLLAWKNSPYRKPLLLQGARQVGKTWALQEFGRLHYQNVAYVSLEEFAPGHPSEYASIFETSKDPKRIISNLGFALGEPIHPETTLIVLDEIQDCPSALGSLKYFCEEAPEYHIACAGSLLGVSLASKNHVFPVGKVDFLKMYPLTFSEFLKAADVSNLSEYAANIQEIVPTPAVIENAFIEHLQRYFACGGMPEAVLRWVQTKDMASVQQVQRNLLEGYERDFAKHGGESLFAKLSLVWASLPAQLARENKKFLYGLVAQGARAREYEDAIQWLASAGLIYKVPRSSRPGLPVSAYDETSSFKLFCFDVGLLGCLARLSPKVFAEPTNMFREFKGAFAENYVLQSLVPKLDEFPRYWANAKPSHEVDFLIQLDEHIVPIEVKSGANIKSASLKYYAQKYKEDTPLKVRISLRNLSLDGDLLNLPLYLSDETCRLIGSVLR